MPSFIIFCLLLTQLAFGQDIAYQKYKKGQYAEAITQWSQQLKSEPHNDALYYNIGNAYFKSNNIIEATLYYQKAVKQNYNNQKAQHNLKICRAKLKLETEPNELFLTVFFKKIIYLFRIDTMIWLMIGCSFLFSIGFIAHHRNKQSIYRYLYSATIAFFTILCILFLFQRQYRSKNNTFLIISDHPMGYKNVSKNGKGMELKKGEMVTIIESFNQQIQVETENNETLWIGKEDVKSI